MFRHSIEEVRCNSTRRPSICSFETLALGNLGGIAGHSCALAATHGEPNEAANNMAAIPAKCRLNINDARWLARCNPLSGAPIIANMTGRNGEGTSALGTSGIE